MLYLLLSTEPEHPCARLAVRSLSSHKQRSPDRHRYGILQGKIYGWLKHGQEPTKYSPACSKEAKKSYAPEGEDKKGTMPPMVKTLLDLSLFHTVCFTISSTISSCVRVLGKRNSSFSPYDGQPITNDFQGCVRNQIIINILLYFSGEKQILVFEPMERVAQKAAFPEDMCGQVPSICWTRSMKKITLNLKKKDHSCSFHRTQGLL